MKKNHKLVTGIIVSTIMGVTHLAKAQWKNYSIFSGNTFHQPDYSIYPDVESVGIGDFNQAITWGIGTQPRSAFHIGTNYFFSLPGSPSYANLGEVFRTTCPADMSTYWRMERAGGEEAGFVEYGMLYSLGGTDEVALFPDASADYGVHFYMQSSFAKGNGASRGCVT